jgi:hypothetical protein
MHGRTLCVQVDAERRTLRYHAERGNDQNTELCAGSRFGIQPRSCGRCWSRATARAAIGRCGGSGTRSSTDPPHRCRRDLRRLPQEPRLALDLWELLEPCDSRESGGSGNPFVNWPTASLPSHGSGFSHRDRIGLQLIVPRLCVGMHGRTLRVQVDAERRTLRYHAERGNDQMSLGVFPRRRDDIQAVQLQTR